jgi:hypothetical protein
MFLNLFFAAALTRHFDFLLEIPLAHYVRGGMVCAAERERGKKKGGGRKSFVIRQPTAALLFPL